VDFSGGVASLVASRVFARLGINAIVMEGFTNANVVGRGISRDALEGFGDGPRSHFAEALDRVGRIVPTVGAAFGAVVGPTGEDVQFVDDKGDYVPPDVMLACMLSRMSPQKVVLPINLSRGYEAILEENGRSPRGEPDGSRRRALCIPGLPTGPRLFSHARACP
jgi:mannose-1-phosphate guanylyltransferase/phosphomannomutase